MQSLTQEIPRIGRRAFTRTSEEALEDFVRALAWSPNGRRLVAVTLIGTAHIIDGAGVWMGVPGMHTGGAFSVAWSPDGALFATGGGDGRLFLHDGSTTLLAAVASVGDGWVEHLAWSPDGRCLAATAGKTLRFFARDARPVGAPAVHEATITSLAWLPDSPSVITTSGNSAQVVEVGLPGPARRMAGWGVITAACLSRDARWLATSNHEASVRIWGLDSSDEVAITGYPRKISALAWSPDESVLASAGGPNITLSSLDARRHGRGMPTALAWHQRPVTSLAFSSRGARLLSVGEDGVLHVARRDRVRLREFWESEYVDATEVPLSSLAVTANGLRVAAAGRGGRVFTWRLGG